jgi:ribosomal protein S27E
MLYQRLLKGSVWIGDWKSTGLKSRSTVHQRLKHLKVLRLVEARKEGHKILYELRPFQKPNGAVTIEGINWRSLLHPTSRKELRHSRRRYMKALRELSKLDKKSDRRRQYFIWFLDKRIATLDSPQGREVWEILKKLGLDINNIPIRKLLEFLIFPNFEETLCLSCLRKGKITYLTFDEETGEVFCPIEGTVMDRPFKEYPEFVLPRQKWRSNYERKTVDIECPDCNHRNRVPAKKVFVKGTDRFGVTTTTPMMETFGVEKCKECGKLIAEPKDRKGIARS